MWNLKELIMTDLFIKFKPIIFLVVLPTIVIFGFIFLTAGAAQKPSDQLVDVATSNSSVKLDTNSYDFGTISQKDGLVNTVYQVTNTGSEDIYLNELYTSCSCTVAQLIFADGSKSGLFSMKGMSNFQNFVVGKYLKPGETVTIKATFDPNAHGPQGIGYIKRNIMLSTNLKDNSLIQVSFEANVTR
jgi:hypothetical protein